MLEHFKDQWRRDGLSTPARTVKRESLRTKKIISESELKRWETERMQMLENLQQSRTIKPYRELVQRESLTRNLNISEKDIQNFEIERQLQLENLKQKYL